MRVRTEGRREKDESITVGVGNNCLLNLVQAIFSCIRDSPRERMQII